MEFKYKIYLFGGMILVGLALFVSALEQVSPEDNFFTNQTTVNLNVTQNNVSAGNVSFYVNTSANYNEGNLICFFENITVGRSVDCDFTGIENTIPTENLVLHLRMNNNSGNVATQDDSGNGNSIVTVSGAVFGANSGNVLGGYSLDGANDYLAINDDNSLDITNNWTMAGWINRIDGTLATLGRNTLFSKDGVADTTGAYNFYINPFDGSSSFTYESNNNVPTCNAPSGLLPDNEWHHVAITFESGSVGMYIDGELVSSCDSAPAPTANTRQLILGRRAGNNGWFKGAMDDLMIFNKSLSESEMSSLYLQGDGTYFWKANSTNGEITGSKNFTIDTILPVINSNVSDGARLPNTDQGMNITVVDLHPENLIVSIDGVEEFNGISTNFTEEFTFDKGVHKMSVTANDSASNTNFKNFLFYILEDNFKITMFSNEGISFAVNSEDSIIMEVIG